MKTFEFRPKLYDALKNYSKETLLSDLMAGIIVGIVALPLAIAFGIASGVSPERIITANHCRFYHFILGGSKLQIGGQPAPLFVLSLAFYSNRRKGLLLQPVWPVSIDSLGFLNWEHY